MTYVIFMSGLFPFVPLYYLASFRGKNQANFLSYKLDP